MLGARRRPCSHTRRRVNSGLPCPPCHAGATPLGFETVRAPHDGSKPGLAPSGGAAAIGPKGAQVAHAAPEKGGGGAAATGPNGAQVARTALEWGGRRPPGSTVDLLGTEVRERNGPREV